MARQVKADPQKIYIYRFPNREFLEIAMEVDTSRKKFDGICFQTTSGHGHAIKGKVGRKTESGFIFISEGFEPGEWEFSELTYDVLKAGFYKHIYAGEKLLEMVHNTQELQDYYHANFPDYA